MKICSCTGHRPKGFPFAYGKDEENHNEYLKQLKEKILFVINECDVTHFISGMAIGADMDFAEIVLNLRDEDRCNITLECAIPCQNQTLKWKKADKLCYDNILKRTDELNIISEVYTPECMLKRNRYLVDKCDFLIAVFNGIERGGTWYTIKYAMKKDKIIKFINLC